MTLEKYDLHLILSPTGEKLKVFSAEGTCLLECEARNRTVAHDGFSHHSACPPGEFVLGTPVRKGTVPFGPYFIPILDYQGHHAMRDFHRDGVGLHGGGSGLADPFAPQQGWQVTEGCWRLQNLDLLTLVGMVKAAQHEGGRCYVTVDAPTG